MASHTGARLEHEVLDVVTILLACKAQLLETVQDDI